MTTTLPDEFDQLAQRWQHVVAQLPPTADVWLRCACASCFANALARREACRAWEAFAIVMGHLAALNLPLDLETPTAQLAEARARLREWVDRDRVAVDEFEKLLWSALAAIHEPDHVH